MKQRMKRLTIFLTIIIGGLCLFGGCSKKQESGDFSYYVSASDKDIVILEGLSELGKEKKVIIIPEFIDGKFVDELGARGFWGDSGLASENLETLYIQGAPYCMGWGHSPKLKKIVLLKAEMRDERLSSYISDEWGTNVYVCSSMHLISEKYDDYLANISYLYNYEGAENEGYYWVDNFDYGEKIEYIPENPEREGYKFGGWYKEAECENVWNFDKDTLPEATYKEEGEELYQETRLYAKWYKN